MRKRSPKNYVDEILAFFDHLHNAYLVSGSYSFSATVYFSGCVSMGSMGSAEPMEFWRRVPEPMDFEQIVKQMQENIMFEL